MLRRALIWFFQRVVAIYFRSIETAGAAPAADTAGRLFVSNHVNGLIDPMLVLTAAACPISPVAKSTLWSVPVLRWMLDIVEAVPVVRRRDEPGKAEGANDGAFERVAGWLKDGGNILIFPEGTSHNEPYVLAVRTGAARMLVRAFRAGAAEATFQAVALEFDARHQFRSRCLLVYGPVRAVAALAAGSSGDEALVTAITSQIQGDLEELLVEGATWPERLLIARVAEMLVHDASNSIRGSEGGDATLAQWNEIGRQVEAARKTLRQLDEGRVASVADAVDRYYALLEAEGLRDHELAVAPPPVSPGWILLLPLGLLGMLLYWLPYQAPRLATRKAQEVDVVSTYKLAVGLVVHPLWAALLSGLAWWHLQAGLAALATAVLVTSPFAALATADALRSLRRARGRHAEVRAAREQAMARIQETRALIEAQT